MARLRLIHHLSSSTFRPRAIAERITKRAGNSDVRLSELSGHWLGLVMRRIIFIQLSDGLTTQQPARNMQYTLNCHVKEFKLEFLRIKWVAYVRNFHGCSWKTAPPSVARQLYIYGFPLCIAVPLDKCFRMNMAN